MNTVVEWWRVVRCRSLAEVHVQAEFRLFVKQWRAGASSLINPAPSSRDNKTAIRSRYNGCDITSWLGCTVCRRGAERGAGHGVVAKVFVQKGDFWSF